MKKLSKVWVIETLECNKWCPEEVYATKKEAIASAARYFFWTDYRVVRYDRVEEIEE